MNAKKEKSQDSDNLMDGDNEEMNTFVIVKNERINIHAKSGDETACNGDGHTNTDGNHNKSKVCNPSDEATGKNIDYIHEKMKSHKGLKNAKTKATLRCDDCNLTFKKPYDYKTHMTKHTGEANFTCEICGISKRMKLYIQRHMLSAHDIDTRINPVKPKVRKQKPIKVEYQCPECNKSFKAKSLLDNHMTVHTGEAKFCCDLCGNIFKRKLYLQRHMYNRHDIDTRIWRKAPFLFTCAVCQEQFPKQSLLKHHMRDANHRPYRCEKCPKTFYTRRSLVDHMVAKHDGLPRKSPSSSSSLRGPGQVCHICGKKFMHLSSLNVHLDTHSSEKHHLCPVCGKGLATKVGLTSHMMIHSGEKKHYCSVCNRAFLRKEGLTKHEATHNRDKLFTCHICQKPFATKMTLRNHANTHTGIRPHKCPACDKTFARHANLVLHQRKHTGEKPYPCQVCGQRFSQLSNMTKHIVNIHNMSKPGRRENHSEALMSTAEPLNGKKEPVYGSLSSLPIASEFSTDADSLSNSEIYQIQHGEAKSSGIHEIKPHANADCTSSIYSSL